MAEEKLPTRAEDFAEWYNQLVVRADLADYAPVRGCMVVKPYGWALWENITAWLDAMPVSGTLILRVCPREALLQMDPPRQADELAQVHAIGEA